MTKFKQRLDKLVKLRIKYCGWINQREANDGLKLAEELHAEVERLQARHSHIKGCEVQFDSPCTCEEIMEQEQVDRIISRFLNWKLPKDFNPDCGIKYENLGHYPHGTNLFTSKQAEAMIRYILEDELKSLTCKVSAELEIQKDNVRCMSKVFDDLADELGVPKAKHGDPDFLFDAIDTLRTAADNMKEALEFYAGCVIAGKITLYNDDGSIAPRARLIQDNGKLARDTLSTCEQARGE